MEAPCDTFDPWVRWEGPGWDLRVRAALAVSGDLESWEVWKYGRSKFENFKMSSVKMRHFKIVGRVLK